MSNLIDSKVNAVLAALSRINEQVGKDCTVEKRDDDSALIYGPFPSFLILVQKFNAPRALIHVNADAANLAYLFLELSKTEGATEIDGAFAVDEVTGMILQGPEAYAKKESNILKFADEILGRRLAARHEANGGIALPPEKQIILG